MNLTPAQAQPVAVTTTITRVGSDMPRELSLPSRGDQISDAPEVGAADQVVTPAGSVQQTLAGQSSPIFEAAAEQLLLDSRPEQSSAEERGQQAEQGYALSQEAYGIPPQPEVQISA